MNTPYSRQFFNLCSYALMAEVSATPKPGLVDRHDSGAHTDMCFSTFEASSAAIAPFLTAMFELGFSWNPADAPGLFASIRPIGIEAEKAMFRATGNINTHKGMIFSMGIIAAASGLSLASKNRIQSDEVLALSKEMCQEALEQDFQRMDRTNPKTHGEILFVRHGVRGIRGEAQQGFPALRNHALPALSRQLALGTDENTAHLNTLLALMSEVDDTNVLIRSDFASLEFCKQEARRILALGGASTEKGIQELSRLNQIFIEKHISPGGCADLLAVSILLNRLEALPTAAPDTL